MSDKSTRSLAKTISWRVIATLTTMIIVLILTGELTLSLVAGGIDVGAKLILYFVHERVWNKIRWGRR